MKLNLPRINDIWKFGTWEPEIIKELSKRYLSDNYSGDLNEVYDWIKYSKFKLISRGNR